MMIEMIEFTANTWKKNLDITFLSHRNALDSMHWFWAKMRWGQLCSKPVWLSLFCKTQK